MIYLLALIQLLGRGNAPIYQAQIPPSWKQLPRESDLQDTTHPIASFRIDEVLVTIHNFPYLTIPPRSQIERWQKQLGLAPSMVTPSTHGGFVGLILESEKMIAAAFELAPVHQMEPCEKSCSWTIKAVGPVNPIRSDLLKLIHSFETIEEFQ